MDRDKLKSVASKLLDRNETKLAREVLALEDPLSVARESLKENAQHMIQDLGDDDGSLTKTLAQIDTADLNELANIANLALDYDLNAFMSLFLDHEVYDPDEDLTEEDLALLKKLNNGKPFTYSLYGWST